MVYECEKCGKALPTGVTKCPSCGDSFDEAVPADAEVPTGKFTARTATSDTEPFTMHAVAAPRGWAVEPKMVVGLIAAAFLFIGAFAPIISIPVVGSVNYFQNGKGDGVILIVLAAISVVLALTRKYDGLWLTGALSLGLLAFTFLNLETGLSTAQASMKADMAGNPFAGIGDAMVQSVEIQWGWAVLVVGAALLFGAAALTPSPIPQGEPRPRRSALAPALSGVLLLVLVVGAFAYTSHQKQVADDHLKAIQAQQVVQQQQAQQDAQAQQAAEDAEAQAKQDALNELVLGKSAWDTEDDGMERFLVGTVKNTSDRSVSFVSVSFNLTDSSGDKVGTAEDTVENLDPGETWRFKAMVTDDTATSANFDRITGTVQ